ncbi:MAG: hypothetical protein AB7C90_08485, partial [Bacteroidales bacterium]
MERAGGSLLGVAVRKKKMSVPIGKVQLLRMYPITFKEFLRASDPQTFTYVDSLKQIEPLPEIILHKLALEYKRYLICGGMPDAVTALLGNEGIQTVENVLQNILDLYTLDFSKYAAPVDIARIQNVWNSLPSQLAKENRKFLSIRYSMNNLKQTNHLLNIPTALADWTPIFSRASAA